MKNIIIGGIATVIVAAGAIILVNWNQWSHIDTLDDLVKDYQELSEDVKLSKTKSDLLAACENPGGFNKQIQELENTLARLRQRKNDITNTPIEVKEEEYIPRLGEQVPDLWEPDPIQQEEYIPKPGQFPLDLDGNIVIENEKEYIPRLGEQVPDLWEPDPIQQEEYIPRLGEQSLDFIENTSILSEITVLEEEILTELNNLKSLCDNQEKKKKEIISNSCIDACKKYSECTHYTQDTTEQDRKDAYDSCMIECADWSNKTKICINKKPIKTVSDCTNLSIGALSEYGNNLEK